MGQSLSTKDDKAPKSVSAAKRQAEARSREKGDFSNRSVIGGEEGEMGDHVLYPMSMQPCPCTIRDPAGHHAHVPCTSSCNP